MNTNNNEQIKNLKILCGILSVMFISVSCFAGYLFKSYTYVNELEQKLVAKEENLTARVVSICMDTYKNMKNENAVPVSTSSLSKVQEILVSEVDIEIKEIASKTVPMGSSNKKTVKQLFEEKNSRTVASINN